ncbi:MAG: hypothetical protein ACYS0H_14100, partial [Planctomycetota bacterium]
MQDHRHVETAYALNRRSFLAAAGATYGTLTIPWLNAGAAKSRQSPRRRKEGATVRAVFLYPPSTAFSDDPDGWWSWPGNEFDAEGRQKSYTAALQEVEKRLGMKVITQKRPVANNADAQQLIRELETTRPDGLLLIMFYNRSLPQADLLLEASRKLEIPAIFFIGLGVKHGAVDNYRRPGVYFIQSLDNLKAIEYGLRMINTRQHLKQSLLLSITEAERPRESTEKFLGTKVRVIPFSRYADLFGKVKIDGEARTLIKRISAGASEVRGISQ